ncbi:hypothetical protein DEU56DRAFT_762609 [Suillus clintonianus]|uniref:uncharacterized protein n=1 Tax=Suillus clintonianus TaxID=1904413 RepID=UPI001B860738|nr:uncharacterized protein DEU56DRAFT_762608 [Suillus clintonianus]XP_041200500.1 uncharacterized protein DEU56DRAFT_762609 [Suillus clintonianus]KAG2107601.1 hypothetical protein DEU56DRAFT_762608 [Suillus clintonianus]KAG2107602.1 hypothetical protein DEU56DRAFT_762609 [Suillus clintonianus]
MKQNNALRNGGSDLGLRFTPDYDNDNEENQDNPHQVDYDHKDIPAKIKENQANWDADSDLGLRITQVKRHNSKDQRQIKKMRPGPGPGMQYHRLQKSRKHPHDKDKDQDTIQCNSPRQPSQRYEMQCHTILCNTIRYHSRSEDKKNEGIHMLGFAYHRFKDQISSKMRRHQTNIFAKIKQNQVNSRIDSDLGLRITPNQRHRTQDYDIRYNQTNITIASQAIPYDQTSITIATEIKDNQAIPQQSKRQKSSKIRPHHSNIFAKIKQNQVDSHADSDLSLHVTPNQHHRTQDHDSKDHDVPSDQTSITLASQAIPYDQAAPYQYKHRKSSKMRPYQSDIFAKIKQNQVNSHADSDLSQRVPPNQGYHTQDYDSKYQAKSSQVRHGF